MEYKKIGTTGIDVSTLSLGSWYVYSRLTYEAGVSLVKSALDLGINFFDVAYYRNSVHTELIWSRLIKGAGAKRSDYRVAGKLWYFSYPEETLMAQADRVLQRLDDDYMDVVITEHPREGMDVEQLVQELSGIVDAGKARCWGALNWTPADFIRASEFAKAEGLHGPQLAQLKYSVARRNVVEGPYKEAFEKTGASLHASDTLEGGILAGTLQPSRHIGIDVGDIRDDIRGIVPAIQDAASALGVTAGQLSLAWALTNPQLASLLFGATKPERLSENVRAVELALEKATEIREALDGLGIDAHDLDAPYPHDKPIIGDYVA